MPFTHYSPVTVNSGQVPSTQTNFPMLVSYTDNRLKTIANGGKVANASGYDIRPYSNSGLTSALTYELEFYDGTNGIVVMWVKVPSLADASVVYLGYGDAALSSDGSSTSTWDSNYKAVYHLKEATSTNNVDSTVGANTLTVTASPVQTAGKVGGSLSYNGSTQYSVASSAATIVNPSATDLSISCWINAGSFQQVSSISPRVVFLNIDGNNTFAFILDGGVDAPTANVFTLAVKDGAADLAKWTTETFSVDTWYYVVLYYDSVDPDISISVNGVVKSLTTNGATPFGVGTADNKLYLARRSDGSGPATVLLDEVRISDIGRTINWSLTEYNNQSAPSTFATLGTEVVVGRVGSMLGVFQ